MPRASATTWPRLEWGVNGYEVRSYISEPDRPKRNGKVQHRRWQNKGEAGVTGPPSTWPVGQNFWLIPRKRWRDGLGQTDNLWRAGTEVGADGVF
jgi:hypothetical protein